MKRQNAAAEDAWTEVADIAAVMGMKRTAVAMTVSRAIRRLRWPPGKRPKQSRWNPEDKAVGS